MYTYLMPLKRELSDDVAKSKDSQRKVAGYLISDVPNGSLIYYSDAMTSYSSFHAFPQCHGKTHMHH